jgi:AcrR family transcriptional regulator
MVCAMGGVLTAIRRQYDMQIRGQAQAAIRERAVAAACSLLAAPAYHESTLEAVAAAAGVSRVTVYNHFGSRRGLLLAVFAEIGRRMGAARIREAMHTADARQALRAVVRESTQAWQRERRMISRILALGALDTEVGREVVRSERRRRASLVELAGRLAERGDLPRHLAVAEAAALLGAVTSFQTYEAFALAAKGERIEARLLSLAEGVLGLSRSRRSVTQRRLGA